MNFKRKRIRGQKTKVKRTWLSEDGNYRVTWAREIAGIRMDAPVIHACVRTEWGWGFAGKRGPYKTLKAARRACEDHRKVWDKFLTIEGRTKVTQVRDLRARSMVGTGRAAVSTMSDVPQWVVGRADPRLLEILNPSLTCNYQDDPMPTSKSSDVPGGTTANATDGPACDAVGEEITATSTKAENAARRAVARAKAPAKRSPKRTVKRSSVGGGRVKRSTSTTSSSSRSRKKSGGS